MNIVHRKLFHIGTILPFAILIFFIDDQIPRSFFIWAGAILFIVFAFFEYYRFKERKIQDTLMKNFSSLFKEKEKKKITSLIFGPVALIILVLFFSKFAIISAIWVGCVSDSVAALVGVKYGTKKNHLDKTWEGSAGYFVSAFILLILLNILLGGPLAWFWLLGVALLAALVERVTSVLDDNLVVPVVVAIAIELLYNISIIF